MCIFILIILHSSDPVMDFPMDELNGATLVGAISGNVINGVTLVPGRFRNALFTNGAMQQYVTYGNHDTECFANASVCTGGLTYSLWMRINATFSVFASGVNSGSVGVQLKYSATAHRLKAIQIHWEDGQCISRMLATCCVYLVHPKWHADVHQWL